MNIFARILALPIYIYKYAISPLIPPRCRFTPTCSEYCLEAIEKHGAVKGGRLAVKRLCKCHPFGGGHGYDPVPEPAKKTQKDRRKS